MQADLQQAGVTPTTQLPMLETDPTIYDYGAQSCLCRLIQTLPCHCINGSAHASSLRDVLRACLPFLALAQASVHLLLLQRHTPLPVPPPVATGRLQSCLRSSRLEMWMLLAACLPRPPNPTPTSRTLLLARREGREQAVRRKACGATGPSVAPAPRSPLLRSCPVAQALRQVNAPP